jgi:hypothetical protein
MIPLHRIQPLFGACGVAVALAGCGGPDLGSAGRTSNFDQGLSGNYSSYGNNGTRSGGPATGVAGRGAYPKVEGTFELGDVKGNPFDYTENDVMVTLQRPDNRTVKIPAFFDGGAANKTWKFRYTPDTTGRFVVQRVTLNGKEATPDKLDKREIDVTGSATPGFVRRDTRDKARFEFDNGNSYYPLGENVAWTDKPEETAAQFEKMSKVGENWSRLWITHFTGMNPDWPAKGKPGPLGQLDLDTLKKWDSILDAAEKNGIYFQLALQHHGQYSTRVNPNWDDNPWNKKNGGFLATPDEFFSSPKAIALTKAKYRYIIARYGWSPNVMAWELFNEVEWTDAVNHKHQDEVAAWHNEMASFLRQQDPYRHLITSSSMSSVASLGNQLDYFQPHSYSPDPISAIASIDTHKMERPVFFGEIGPAEGTKVDADWLQRTLWAGAMSDLAGAPQVWHWQEVDKQSLFDQYRAVSDFLKQSGLNSKRNLTTSVPTVESTERGPLVLSPGSGWGQAAQTEFTVLPSGAVAGLGGMPAYLQGSTNRSLFPSATFKTTYGSAGTFAVTVGQAAKAGAALNITVDGQSGAEKTFKAGTKDSDVNQTVEVKIAAGDHTIRLENPGDDWLTIRKITLTPYAPALGAVGKSSKDYAAYWLYRRGSGKDAVKAKLTVNGLQSGAYQATWYDTSTGKHLSQEEATASSSGLVLNTPAVEKDVAVTISKAGEKTASRPVKEKKPKSAKGTATTN